MLAVNAPSTPLRQRSDSTPLVSIVMIFLNGERFIDEAVRSVLAQTCSAWELLFVDDGSTDQSAAIARRYVAEYPSKIRYLHHAGHENRGMSASRNLGIRSSRGRFLALLDCDDVWHPEKLARQVAILEQQPEAAMVYSATLQWFTWPGAPAGGRRDEPRPLGVKPDQLVRPPEMIPIFLRDIGNTPATCSVLMRREAVESVGAFEESFRGLHEDQAFFYKFFLRHPVFVQSGCWDWYRQHPQSCCSAAEAAGISVRSPVNPSHGRFLEWVRAYLAATGVEDRRIRAALTYARRPFRHPRGYQLAQTYVAGRRHVLRVLLSLARRLLPSTAYTRLRARTVR
ncbi:MAG TPA: glycosyltransferase family A protein [Opitutaceae bacterium]